jgi:hypothetical protein
MRNEQTVLGGSAALLVAAAATAGVPCGDWSLIDVPDFGGSPLIPGHITAFAPDDALALGQVQGANPLLVAWNGVAWSATEAGPLGLSPADIRGVRILAGDDIWVCGLTVEDAHGRPFLAHWDGDAWDSEVAVVLDDPNPDGGDPLRNAEGADLAVLAPDDIWVIGAADAIGISGGNAGDFIACHWDGSSLEELEIIPNLYNRINQVQDVDAAAPDDIWAVGYGRNLTQPFHALMYHWDGSSWTPISDWTPLPGSSVLTETLWDVAAPAPDDAWAVGDQSDGTGTSASLYLHWDGSSWTEVPGPDIGPLTSVAHNGPDDVWVSCGFGEYGGRLAHWDGSGWTEVPSAPIPEAMLVGLGGLATSGGCDVWATGYWAVYDGGSWVFQSIIEHLEPTTSCAADCTGDGVVNVDDLLAVIVAWGAVGAAEDISGDGVVGVDDLTMVILAWGACP